MPDVGEDEAPHVVVAPGGLLQDVELDVEQFLELHALACGVEHLGVGREVDVLQRVLQPRQGVLCKQVGRQGFGPVAAGQGLQGVEDDFLQCLGVEVGILHLLGGVVEGLQPRRSGCGERGGFLHLGVHDAVVPVEAGGLAEHHVLGVHLELVLDVAQALEPHQLDAAVPVGEGGGESLVAPLALLIEAQDAPPHLDVGHVRRKLVQVVEAAAVHVLVGEMAQQVVHRADAQFLPQQCGALRPHTRDVGDVLLRIVHVPWRWRLQRYGKRGAKQSSLLEIGRQAWCADRRVGDLARSDGVRRCRGMCHGEYFCILGSRRLNLLVFIFPVG